VDLVTVLAVFPLILLMGAAAQPAGWMVEPSLLLGKASYGIYVLHTPLVALEEQMWSHLRHRTAESDAPWSGLFFLISTVLFVMVLDTVYDVPIRRWLKSRLDRGYGKQDIGSAGRVADKTGAGSPAAGGC